MAPTKTTQRKIEKFGIARFSRPRGTQDEGVRRAMGVMLDDLTEGEERQLVWSLHRGWVSLPAAFAAYSSKGVRGIKERLIDLTLCAETFSKYGTSTRSDDNHQHSYRVCCCDPSEPFAFASSQLNGQDSGRPQLPARSTSAAPG